MSAYDVAAREDRRAVHPSPPWPWWLTLLLLPLLLACLGVFFLPADYGALGAGQPISPQNAHYFRTVTLVFLLYALFVRRGHSWQLSAVLAVMALGMTVQVARGLDGPVPMPLGQFLAVLGVTLLGLISMIRPTVHQRLEWAEGEARRLRAENRDLRARLDGVYGGHKEH